MACFGAHCHCRLLCLLAALLTAGCMRPRAEIRDPFEVGRGTQNFNFIPFTGAVPVGLNIKSGYELAELKVQWLLLDFGRRLGRYEQAKLAMDVAQLQTDRAFQTVSNEVSVAYYGILRAKALRRTFEDAARRAEMQL